MNQQLPPMRATNALRLFQFLLFTFVGLVIGGMVMGFVTRGGITTLSLRLATVVQDIMVFVFPAVLTAVLVTQRADRFLGTDRGFGIGMLILAVLAMFVSMPAMNALVEWNEGLSLPPALGGLERWMRVSEENARESVAILLGGTSVADLVVSLLIVALLAGFSEEIFFRGVMQRLFSSGRMGPHVAIWLTAFIFSLFHMQFFGFFPRFVLGAFFGYLFYWSGSLWLPVAIHALNNAMVVIAEWHGKTDPGSGLAGVDNIGVGSVWLVAGSLVVTSVVIAAMLIVAGRSYVSHCK